MVTSIGSATSSERYTSTQRDEGPDRSASDGPAAGAAQGRPEARPSLSPYENFNDTFERPGGAPAASRVSATQGLGADRNGVYGDGRTGLGGAAYDAAVLAGNLPAGAPGRAVTLAAVESGLHKPDPESRLGAYAGTRGYPEGTVGAAVHRAIGGIYLALGDYGQERIGRVFNSPEAQALMNQPVDGPAGRRMAELEYQYWQNVRREDPLSAGGLMGSMFDPAARDFIQRRFGGR